MYLDLETGTKIRKNDLDFFNPEKPESMDIKITNKCDMGCAFCHENSTPDGLHGDIMNLKFIETLLPYTELAIGGGNPLTHPDLIPFLEKCKALKLVPSMTINQYHFMKPEYEELIDKLVNEKLIYGLGISLTVASDEFINKIKKYPNAVIHIINGVQSLNQVKKLILYLTSKPKWKMILNLKNKLLSNNSIKYQIIISYMLIVINNLIQFNSN